MRQTKTPHSCGHRVARLATLVMLLGFLGALQSKAQTAYALYNDSTLTFYYDENQPDSNYFDMSFHTDPAYGKVPSWYELCDSVETIVFDASFADYARPTARPGSVATICSRISTVWRISTPTASRA